MGVDGPPEVKVIVEAFSAHGTLSEAPSLCRDVADELCNVFPAVASDRDCQRDAGAAAGEGRGAQRFAEEGSSGPPPPQQRFRKPSERGAELRKDQDDQAREAERKIAKAPSTLPGLDKMGPSPSQPPGAAHRRRAPARGDARVGVV